MATLNELKQFDHYQSKVYKIVKTCNLEGVYFSPWSEYTYKYRLGIERIPTMGFIYAYPTFELAEHYLLEYAYHLPMMANKYFTIIECDALVLKTNAAVPYNHIHVDEYGSMWNAYRSALKQVRTGFNEIEILKSKKVSFDLDFSAILCLSIKPINSFWI